MKTQLMTPLLLTLLFSTQSFAAAKSCKPQFDELTRLWKVGSNGHVDSAGTFIPPSEIVDSRSKKPVTKELSFKDLDRLTKTYALSSSSVVWEPKYPLYGKHATLAPLASHPGETVIILGGYSVEKGPVRGTIKYEDAFEVVLDSDCQLVSFGVPHSPYQLSAVDCSLLSKPVHQAWRASEDSSSLNIADTRQVDVEKLLQSRTKEKLNFKKYVQVVDAMIANCSATGEMKKLTANYLTTADGKIVFDRDTRLPIKTKIQTDPVPVSGGGKTQIMTK